MPDRPRPGHISSADSLALFRARWLIIRKSTILLGAGVHLPCAASNPVKDLGSKPVVLQFKRFSADFRQVKATWSIGVFLAEGSISITNAH